MFSLTVRWKSFEVNTLRYKCVRSDSMSQIMKKWNYIDIQKIGFLVAHHSSLSHIYHEELRAREWKMHGERWGEGKFMYAINVLI